MTFLLAWAIYFCLQSENIKGKETVQTRVEPPILLSRILTFVVAEALVVLIVLGVTLYKMFPLNRPQVFFLTTVVRDELDVRLQELPPRDEYLETYRRGFIREYIKARNEIVKNPELMHKKWNTDGVVRKWSTDAVYADFIHTTMWDIIMNDMPEIDITCPVEFQPRAISPRGNDTYTVEFRYFCADNNGQAYSKDYTIKVKLASDNASGAKWSARLDNPLGLRVAEYTIESNNGDPLDTGFMATE